MVRGRMKAACLLKGGRDQSLKSGQDLFAVLRIDSDIGDNGEF